ncbi:FitA-like ribbon-helix-helix domain-containing protein [Methylovirgula sp. 4M-Z18]|uniref:FitA-like ribbon-helix-helix domain-containing protein n=1 Tax=Methylovirgula sp. 4M-Z18 TaxID=2293567 RepID=UPI000E2F068B|nr:plasmid stabilization protein [Methylovirgula sp. 4M-Z18]RFB81618.1 plasmid stabilization protein [Methylovirgula sp. 4M-Z18]
MASLTIRNLDETLKVRLRVTAAQHGRSMEDEARVILRAALMPQDEPQEHVATTIHRRFAALGGLDLIVPLRTVPRDPPDFSS